MLRGRGSDTNNRLTSTSVGNVTDPYSYAGIDGMTGNITSMPHLSFMQYDYRDQMQGTATQRVNTGTPQTTWNSYDSSGARVRKLTVDAAAAGVKPLATAERIYIGPFEIYRKFAADGTTPILERQSLHVMNAEDRIAIIEIRTLGTNPGPAQQFRYQYGNHLASASLELDEQGNVVSYEEFYPYGSSAYQATASQTDTPKRYRYVGKELDSENGFYFYGARYYAPWLGRWTSTDPAGISAGVNLYEYSKSNPIVFLDPNGAEPENYYRAPGKPGKQAWGFFLGSSAHLIIGYHYKVMHPGHQVFTNFIGIGTILEKSGAGNPAKLQPGEESLKPDIANTTSRGVLELKPWGKTAQEHQEWREEGRDQVRGYLDALNRAAPAKRQFSLMTGESGHMGVRFLGGAEYWRLQWATTEAGLAQYKWERLKRNDIRRLSDQEAFYANEYEDVTEAEAAQYGQQLNETMEWSMKWRGRLDTLRDAVSIATAIIGIGTMAVLNAAISSSQSAGVRGQPTNIAPNVPSPSPATPGLPPPSFPGPGAPMPQMPPIPAMRPPPPPPPMMMGR
jgi:RHS repeat-associated protein